MKDPTITTSNISNSINNNNDEFISFLVMMLLHLLILFTLLTILFTFIVSQVTETAFNEQVSNFSQNVMTDSLTNLDKQSNGNVTQFIVSNQDVLRSLYNVYNVKDQTQIVNNKWLFVSNWVMVLTLLLVLMGFIVFVIWMTPYKVNLFSIIKHDACYFPAVLIAEVSIFYFIAMKLSPITPSELTDYTINRCKGNLVNSGPVEQGVITSTKTTIPPIVNK